MVVLTNEKFKEYIPDLKQKLDKILIKEKDHLIWPRKSKQYKFMGKQYHIHVLLRMINNEEFVDTHPLYSHCCNETNCVDPDHWIAQDTQKGLFIDAHFRLMKHSVEQNGCILFTGMKDKDGYGVIYFNGKYVKVHILSMMIKLGGPIPADKPIVRHKCTTHKNCFFIDHLELGTHADNMQDKIRDGTSLAGEKHISAKLTNEIVLEIYNSRGTKSVRERSKYFSDKYNMRIPEDQISSIDHGHKWSSITGHTKRDRKSNKVILNQDYIDSNHLEIQNKIKNNITEEKYKDDDNHWIWKLGKNKSGYGQAHYGGLYIKAHRLSWMGYNKKVIPETMIVRHMCGVRACVNPKHLEIGTMKENAADKILHGTNYSGEMHVSSTITNQLAIIIYMSQILGITQRERAQLFDVTSGFISRIDTLKCWKNVTSKIDIDESVKELHDYINNDPKRMDATKHIDLTKLDTSTLKHSRAKLLSRPATAPKKRIVINNSAVTKIKPIIRKKIIVKKKQVIYEQS